MSTNESKVPLEGYEDTDESNYLEFTNNERALIKHIKDSGKFKQIVVILNMSNAMEAEELANDDAIGGIVWIGHTGANAVNALGRILRGEVNPSGRTVDVWDAKHSYDPTWFNLRYNTQVDSSNSYYQANGTGGYDLINMAHFTEYEEGIYVGYRYYETAATVECFDYSHGNAATPWSYDDAVTWTFGYGLSYTDFEWTLVSQPTSVTKDGTLTFKVKVENVGEVAGKDVVQLYYSAPYFNGGIEKSIVNLGDFTKTKLLQPGESQVVTLDIETRDMASFDYSDANGNGFRGYELEAGDYTVYLGKDAHCWADEDTLKYEFTISEDAQDTNLSAPAAEGKGANGFAYAEDSVTGNPVYTLSPITITLTRSPVSLSLTADIRVTASQRCTL